MTHAPEYVMGARGFLEPRAGGAPRGFTVCGVYRVYWRDDPEHFSVAAIGGGETGRLWLAPSNWIAPTLTPDWATVERVVLVDRQERG